MLGGLRIVTMPLFGKVAVVVHRKENLKFVGVFTLRNYSIIANAHISLIISIRYTKSIIILITVHFVDLIYCALLRGSAHRQEDIQRL